MLDQVLKSESALMSYRGNHHVFAVFTLPNRVSGSLLLLPISVQRSLYQLPEQSLTMSSHFLIDKPASISARLTSTRAETIHTLRYNIGHNITPAGALGEVSSSRVSHRPA